MAGLGTGAPIVKVYHEKSMILPDVSRVLACLYEKDIEFERHTASYKSLLRLQASSHAPVPFYDGPTFLEESREICRYIAETYEHQGYPFLLGKDSLERSSIEQWLHHEEHAFNPPSRSLFCHLAFPLAEEDDDIELQKEKLEEVLDVYEQRLGDSEFLAGNKFTLADLVHLPNSQYITDSDKFVYLYDSRKNVQRWWNDISTRDSWQKVLKDIQVVEQQRKQEELEKQQQRKWRREHPPTLRRPTRLDSRMHTSTKSETILVRPPLGIGSTSPEASQADKPLPTETSPDETLLPPPAAHKSSAVQSKHTTIFTTHRETPPAPVQSTPRLPGYSHIPVQSTSSTPATSPTTAEIPSRTGADKPEIRGVSLPSEATEIDLPANSKRSSSKEVSHNLRVYSFYEASSHTDEAEPYVEPTPQEPSEMLDRISETDGPSNATDHVKTSPRSAKEDSGASGFWTDNTATNADALDKKSVQYNEHTPQRPVEPIYGGSTDQRATYTSPGKHGSTEAHQKLQTEQWHGTAAGLSNLKGETDYLRPTQQVDPGKDVQHSSSQDSEQVSTYPPAQEPVSMDRQRVQGPEMTTRKPYTDQKRDVPSMLWPKTADVRGIAEEDKASSDHRDAVLPPYAGNRAEEAKIVSADHRKDASPPKHVKDEDTHDIAQEARETVSAPRRRRPQDAYDTSEGIGPYHSSSSRPQPINVPQDAAPPAKQAVPQGPRRVTAPYPAAQEFIKQARESPASRSTEPHDAQGRTEEETVESSSSKDHLLNSRLADARPPKEFKDEDSYGSVPPVRTGYADDTYNRERDRDAPPKRIMSQDAFEETEMTDSTSFEAQTFGHQRADAPPQKQRPPEDPQTTASPLKKRYSGGEDTTEQSKPSASRPRRMAAQETQYNLDETKARDSRSTREQPSDTWQASAPLPRHEADDVHSTTSPSQKRYPGTRGTIKEVEDITPMPRRMAGEDANGTLEETKFAESASSQPQPLYYNRNGAPSREDRLGATSPLERRYADAEDTTKHSRDTASKPRKIMGQDAEDTSEETEAHNSALFRAQPQDPRRVATTPSKQAAEDALSVSRPSPKRYPRVEETSKQPRPAASKPTHIAAQDARDVFRESKVADSTPSIEKPSDARVAAPFQKQEIPDVRNTSASFEKRYPDVKGATKKSKVTFEETESPDSASSRVQPSDSQRDYAPSWKKEAREAPHATAPLKKRDSDVEDTANHSDGAIKPRQMVGQDAQGTYEETKASDSGLLREQSSDAWQPATTPREKVATEDGSERNVSNDEDITTQPKGTASAPRQTIAGDASGAFQESKPADSVSSREQPLSARQPVVTPSRQETGDSLSKISAFHKTRPFVEDITRPAVDTVFGPRQIGAKDTKDITVEKKVADSASSVRARPTYTPRTARPLSEQAEEEEDARDKDRERRETISAPKKMASRDGEHTHGGRKIPHSASREQYLDNLQANSPLKQAAAEDPRGAIRGAKEPLVDETKHSQGVKGASKKSVGTFEERKDPASALPTAHPLSAQDAQHIDRSSRTPTADQQKDASTHIRSNIQDTYQEARSPSARQKGLGSSPSPSPLQAEAGDDDQDIIGEKVFSSEQLRKMLKESQSTSSKAQPADSRSPTKVERTPSVYQEDHLVAPDSHGQPQTLPTGVRADGSTAKRQQAPVVPSSSEEKSNPPTPPRAKVHDDHTTEEPFKRGTVDDPKGAPPLLGRELTSQVQRATERTPDGNMSSKLSTIDQWQRTSAPIQGVTPNSGDDVPGVSTIDQKPTPMSQQSIPSAQSANEMVKRKQRMVPSAPAGAQTPDDQHAPPSLAGADMAERDGEPVQMQAPALHARPTSVPTRRATPEARDAGDNEFANTSDAQRWKALKAKHDSAMINEDDRDASLSTHDATGDKKTAWHASEAQVSDTAPGSTATPVNVRPTSGDKLVQRFSRDQGIKPPESTQAETPLDAPSDSVSTQGVPTDALDKTKFAKASSTEDMRPTAGPASTLEAQLAEHKFSPSDKKSHAAQPQSSVESRKEDTSVSAADQTKKPQTIFRQQARPSTPITKLIPSSNANHDERKIQQANLDNLPTDDSPTPHVQVAHAPQTIPSYRDMTPAPGTRDSPASNAQIASAKFQEAVPDNYRPDELTVPSVSSEKQGSYAGSPTEPHERPSHDAHGAADDKDTTKYPSKQAPVLQYRPDSTSADSYVRPTSGDEPGISPDQGAESPAAAQATNSENRRNEVFPAEKKFVPSDQDSVHSVQQPFPAETRRGETIVAAAEKTMPTNIGQQNTQDTREAPTSNFMPAEDIPSDARSGRPDEVPLAEQKFASSDQDTQLTSSVEPRNEEIRNSTRSVQPLFSAADDQTNDPQTTIGQQDTAPTPGTSKSPSSETHHASGQFQEVAPDDHHTVESLPSEERVSRTKPSSVLSAGPTHDYLDLDKKITKVPSSQAQRSDPKPDPKQNRSDEPPTRFLPSQLPKQRAETQALPPLVGSYGSKSSKDVTSDTLGKAKSLKPSSIDQEAMGSALTPDTHLGSAPGEVAPAGQKLLFKDQDSAHPTQGYSSSEPTKEQSAVTAPNEAKTSTTLFNQQDIGLAQTKMKDPSSGSQYGSQRLQDITPKDQRITGPIPMQQQVPRFEHISKQQVPDQSITPSEPLPVVESRKESTGAEAERKVYQPVTGQRDIRHAPGISEHVLDDDHNKEPVSRKEQVSHEHASEPREGSPPDVHGASLDKKRTPPSSRARSSDPKRDALPKSVDVNPSSGQQSTTKSLHALTRSPPLHESPLFPESNEDIPESFKPPSPNQEVTSPKVVPASAPGTILGTASNEIAPDGKKIPLSARDLARSVQRPFSVESTKDVASSDQMNEARTIIGQGGVTPSTDKEKTPFDLQASELAKAPNEDQEQVHSGSAYEQREGPTGDARGTVDEKMPHPSSQAENSDIAPDSALISSDAHGTSIDGPTTSSRDSEAQPPTGTQIVPALFLEKIESPTPPSTDEELMTPMTSPAPALEAPQDQDLTTSQLSPSVVSRKDVADQTNVSQAGLRKPASSDSTRPSEKIQEFSPDAYLTKSEKSLLPMKGADPVQPPYEASLDLSSDEKTTMIKGDQANTISNVSLSASQEVGQPEDSAVKRPLSEESVSSSSQKNLERTSPEEKSKQQEQIDQSSTISSNDDSIEARRTANPNILTRSGDIQQSQSMQEAQGFRNQQQAEQAVFQSTQKNEMQIQETEAQDNGSDEPEEIRPDSAPISGTSSDGPATSSLGDSLLQPPAGTLNVPAVFLEKIESPRRPSTDPEAMAPMTSPALTADTLQDEDSTQSPELSPSVVSRKGVADANQTDVPQAGLRVPGSSDSTVPSEKIQEFSPDASLTKSAKPLLPMTGSGPVRPPHEASSDLSSDGKPTMIKGEQANTVSNVSFSASQPVGQSENSAVKRPLSEDSVSLFSQKDLERTLPAEKSKQKQQTDQSSIRSSKDDSIEASGVASPNILTTSGDIQPSLPKESMQAAQGSRSQQQAGQGVFQSIQDNKKQIAETEAQDDGSYEPKETRPDSALISGDAHRTSDDGPATSSSRDSRAQPPAGTLNAPAVFLENIESPRPLSADQEPMTSTTSRTAPDALQDQDSTPPQLSSSVVSRKDVANADRTNVSQAGLRQPATSNVTRPSKNGQEYSPDAYLTKSEKPLLPMEGSNPVQTPHEASFDLSSDEKPTMIKGEQANTISNVSLSASQPVGQSENSAVKGPLSGDLVSSFSQKNLERTLPEEKLKQQPQTEQSSTRSSKDDSIQASGITSPNMLTTSGDIQPSPPKESKQAAQGSRNQQQAGQAVLQSVQDNEKQIEETEAQDNGSYEPKEIKPDSAPTSGDARRTSDDGPATSSSRDSWAQPPAETLIVPAIVPAVFLENIDSPRPPSTDQEPMTPMTSPAPAPDAPQDQNSAQSQQLSPSVVSKKDVANAGQTNVPQAGLRELTSSDATRPSEEIQGFSLTKSAKPLLPMTGTNPGQPQHEASVDLSSNGKPSMIKGDQANTISNVSLSASQAVGQSENSEVKGLLSEDLVSPFSQKNYERTSPEEKSNQQQQTDQSNTRPSKGDSVVETRGTTDPDISKSGDAQPSRLKESTQAAKGSRDQQPADQDVFESTLDETNLKQSTNGKNNGASQSDASEQPGEPVPAIQPWSNDTDIGSKPTKDAPGSVQTDKKSDSSSRTSEEPEQQVQNEDRNRGGEPKAPASKTELPEKRNPPSRNESITRQFSIQSEDTDSAELDGSTDDPKSADSDDKHPPS